MSESENSVLLADYTRLEGLSTTEAALLGHFVSIGRPEVFQIPTQVLFNIALGSPQHSLVLDTLDEDDVGGYLQQPSILFHESERCTQWS